MEDYPRAYKKLRKNGRILFHCSRAGGLGDYLRSVPEALALAILLDRAFVLRCDTSTKNEGIHVPWSILVQTHFEGPHIDWRGLPAELPNASNADNLTVIDTVVPRRQASGWHWPSLNWTRSGPQAAAAIRMITSAKSHAALRLLQREPTLAASRFGEMRLLDPLALNGCLLRYLFKPARRLTALLKDALPSHVPERIVSGGGLLPTATLHVRLGDAVFARHSPASRVGGVGFATRPWPWRAERRDSLFRRHPLTAMQCLMRASRVRDAAGTDVGCLACAVVGDATEEIEACAKNALARPVLTRGVAMHPIIAGRYHTNLSRHAYLEKSLLDWWLLARSRATVTLGSSAFSSTAVWFRDAAGDKTGVRIALYNTSQLLSREDAWEAPCTPRASG